MSRSTTSPPSHSSLGQGQGQGQSQHQASTTSVINASTSQACTSILDNDLYKFTMQQAVRQHYPDTPCDYNFTNRSPHIARLPLKSLAWLRQKIDDMAHLHLTPSERSFLETKCPYLTANYLDWLQHEFRFNPQEQIKIDWRAVPSTVAPSSAASTENQGAQNQQIDVDITIAGDWHQVILYEVPILALVSEAFFRFGDQDWTYDGQVELATQKSQRLCQAGAKFAEFGTRRRRDYETQRLVLEGLIAGSPSLSTAGPTGGFLTGTSNLHFAHVMNLTPIGTMAHEWFMGTAAILQDASQANKVALARWAETYPAQVLGIALTDTFTTKAFLATFKGEIARDWIGVRHDSGDAFNFMERMIVHYDQDPLVGPELRRTKKIVFSDGLNTELAIRLQHAAEERGIQATFGIGTHFTNDYRHAKDPSKSHSAAMNIVIKLHSCHGQECVKLSDDQGKESGNPAAVETVRRQIATLF
ncbi:nicotinate phosphoribosyltransferase [Podila minutissima]|nr:nicotinate phosphoribosyltransferase [Podila minutissima]